ncbi:MAG: serine/threonine protein kinase [Deltaproteobacteria bacterium]|nr:serine/threonine protein kinase [Deltaproteobacteria bacterium]
MAGEREPEDGGPSGRPGGATAAGTPPAATHEDWDGPTAGIQASRALRPAQSQAAPRPTTPPPATRDDWDGPTAGIQAPEALRPAQDRVAPQPATPPAATRDDWDGPTAGVEASAALRAAKTQAAAAATVGPPAPVAPWRDGRSPERDDLAPGSRLGDYEVRHPLGDGGIGKVYAGIHSFGGRRVAIRVIPRHLTQFADVAERFTGEVRAVNRLGHPHLVDIYAFGRLPTGHYCLVMEYLEGESLAATLRRTKVMRLDEGVAILLQLCDALAAAHAKGVVHGRLRPGHVWLAPGGPPFVKLTDLGLAALHGQAGMAATTVPGVPPGTPLYLAPEQCLGGRVDRRTDVYALGIMMYEMFAGTTPFASESAITVMSGHTSREPRPPSFHAHLPQALEQIILRAIRKKPEQRYGTVGELAKALKEIRADLPAAQPTLRLDGPT